MQSLPPGPLANTLDPTIARDPERAVAGDVAIIRLDQSRHPERLGRYRILRPLGQGGMGTVYEAYDPKLERKVALKVIALRAWDSDENTRASSNNLLAQAQLVIEAQAQARLIHPNIVTIYDVGNSDRGVFIAMELVVGSTVKHWIYRQRPSWREVLKVFIQAGEGVAAAHHLGIVHRDLKPDNLLLDSELRPRVADFGLALGTLYDAGSALTGITASDSGNAGESPSQQPTHRDIAGTPLYMAPEQHLGETVDARSDQYAFCVSLYEALYGTRPFQARTRQQLLTAIATQNFAPLPRASKVPRWLRAVVLRGLEANPVDRYPSLDDLLTELRRHTDPAIHRSSLLFALTMSCMAGLWSLHGSVMEPTNGCSLSTRELEQTWTTQAQNEIQNAFLATAADFAGDAYLTVERILGERYAEVREATQDFCRIDHGLTMREEAIRECLRDRQEELVGLVQHFRHATVGLVSSAAKTVTSLPSASACHKLKNSTLSVENEQDAIRRTTHRALRHQLSHLELSMRVGVEESPFERLQAADQEARKELDFAALTITNALMAEWKAREMATRQTMALSNRALLLVLANRRDDDELNQHLFNQLYVQGYLLGVQPEAQDLYRLGQSRVQRMGNTALLRANLCLSGTPFLVMTQHVDDALYCLHQALTVFEQEFGPWHEKSIRTREYLAVTKGFHGYDREILPLLHEIVEIRSSILGYAHPELGMSLYNLGAELFRVGDLKQAEAVFARALMSTTNIGNHVQLGLVIPVFLTDIQLALEKPLVALASAEQAVKTLESWHQSHTNAAPGAEITGAEIAVYSRLAKVQIALNRQRAAQASLDHATRLMPHLTPAGIVGGEIAAVIAAELARAAFALDHRDLANRFVKQAVKFLEHSSYAGTEHRVIVLTTQIQLALLQEQPELAKRLLGQSLALLARAEPLDGVQHQLELAIANVDLVRDRASAQTLKNLLDARLSLFETRLETPIHLVRQANRASLKLATLMQRPSDRRR